MSTEAEARALFWRAKFDGHEFVCPSCEEAGSFWEYECRPEVRKCAACGTQVRLRAGTLLDSTKSPVLLWAKALFFMMQGKRGVSALELQRHLKVKSHGFVWSMLQRIRGALSQRDASYKLCGIVEFDGAVFGRRESGEQTEVLLAIETKEFIDAKGRPREKAGFAAAIVANETKVAAQAFAEQALAKGTQVNTDASRHFAISRDSPSTIAPWVARTRRSRAGCPGFTSSSPT